MPGYWTKTQAFLQQLRANNTKEWFEANKAAYDTSWRAPAFALVEAVADEMAALSPALKAEARINGSVRRINRDVRFSKDKTPYSARLHLVFWAGSHPNRSAGMHLVIHPDGYGFGAGAFGLNPDQLAVTRARIMRQEERGTLLQAVAQAQAIGCAFDAPDLKRLPKGHEADPEWEHLLRRKAFVMRTQQNLAGPDWHDLDHARTEVMRLTRACAGLIRWLMTA